MKPPREAAGLGQAGELAQSLAELGESEAACFFLSLKSPLKPPEPKRYSNPSKKTLSRTVKRVDSGALGLSRNAFPYNPPITSLLLSTYSGTLPPETDKPAPSAYKPPAQSQRAEASSPEVIGGDSSTQTGSTQAPAPLPFTPAPRVEYRDLCEYHASLTAYIEREAPEMRAIGDSDALSELETLAGKMLDRMGELEAQGAHLTGSAGGSL